MVHRKSFRSKPGDDLRLIARIEPEAIAELLRREPAMKARGGGILLVGQKALEFRLLSRGWLHHQHHIMQLLSRIDRAAVEFRLG